jgi:hypothetical protein
MVDPKRVPYRNVVAKKVHNSCLLVTDFPEPTSDCVVKSTILSIAGSSRNWKVFTAFTSRPLNVKQASSIDSSVQSNVFLRLSPIWSSTNSSSSIMVNAAVSSISVHPFFHAARLSGRTPSSAAGGGGPSLSFILTFRKIILVKDGVMSVTRDDCFLLACRSMGRRLLDGGKHSLDGGKTGGLERPWLVQMYAFSEPPQLGGFSFHVALGRLYMGTPPTIGGFQIGSRDITMVGSLSCGARVLPTCTDHSENIAWLGSTKIVPFPNIRISPRV